MPIKLFQQDFSVIYYMLALPDSKEVDVLQEKVSQHSFDTVPLFNKSNFML